MGNRKLTNTLSFVLMISDILATIVAWEFSYYIRFVVMDNSQGGLFEIFLYYSFVLAGLVVLFSTSNHLYISSRYFSWYNEFFLVIKSQIQAVAAFVILLYFTQPDRLSRLTIGLYAGFGFITILIARGLFRGLLEKTRRQGHNLRHVLVVGQGTDLEHYVNLLSKHPEKGVRFTGWIKDSGLAKKYNIAQKNLEEIPLHGPDAPDAVIIGYNSNNHYELDPILFFFNKTPIQTLIIPDIENAFIGYTIEEFHGVPMISINPARPNAIQLFLKRLMDLSISFIGLTMLLPFFIIIAILIKLTSRGPVFFGQERMTQNGDIFTIWKFRSMYINAEKDGAKWAQKGDNRCTPVGKVLRKISLDELPQLWNVLKGEMSLVGPRPERPVFIEQFKHEIPSYMLRHRMKSGITGWAQVNGWRGETSLVNRIECDLYYIRHWSLVLDIKILFLTFLRGFVHENAY
ncbi:MAG: undecaprenyl-phosphate glucose phosphotransferase [Spirochaeta sp. LUC14_002_19_P3]|nr:MAG: undecaprenyl-phosphate glucose phosphotransferase [Spirochaeta sp. LUC14_002_19_P3]